MAQADESIFMNFVQKANAEKPASVSGGKRPRTKRAAGSKRTGKGRTYKSLNALKKSKQMTKKQKENLPAAFKIVARLKKTSRGYKDAVIASKETKMTIEELVAKYMDKFDVEALDALRMTVNLARDKSKRITVNTLKRQHMTSDKGGKSSGKGTIKFEPHNAKKRAAERLAYYKESSCHEEKDAASLGKAITAYRKKDNRNTPKTREERLRYIDAHRDWAKAVKRSGKMFVGSDGRKAPVQLVPTRTDLQRLDAKKATAWYRHLRSRLHPTVGRMTRRERIEYLHDSRHFLPWGGVKVVGSSAHWANKSKKRVAACNLNKVKNKYPNHRVRSHRPRQPNSRANFVRNWAKGEGAKYRGTKAFFKEAAAAWNNLSPADKASWKPDN